MKHLLLETSEDVAVLTVNRPESMNALNSEVLSELADAMERLERDRSVKVVVLTGAGEKAFVAGADIAQMVDMDADAALDFARQGQQAMHRIEMMKKPVIAAINGYALGGGLELALACDFIYASEKARLGLPEVTLGIMPGFGGTQNLSRRIGSARAKEMIFTGKIILADQALEWALVNAVFPAADLLSSALETARAIARNGQRGVVAAKEAVRLGLEVSKNNGFFYESTLFSSLFTTEDQTEGMQAFLAKRRPEFTGR